MNPCKLSCRKLFCKSLLQCWQDVLVVTAPGSGAEVIPFLKTYVNLPMAIGFTVLYAKVHSNSLLSLLSYQMQQ